jgi:hypothetical protein
MLRLPAVFAAAAMIIALGGCGTPTSPSNVDHERIAQLWSEGQSNLLQMNKDWQSKGKPTIKGNVLSVSHTRFLFVSHEEPLSLDGESVAGYFLPNSRAIHYYQPLMTGSIPHEACHAILHELRDPRWICACHNDCR